MHQVDGCASQRNGLRFRLLPPRFSRRENLSVVRSLVGWLWQIWSVDRQGTGAGQNEGERQIKGRESFVDVGYIFASRKSSSALPFPAMAQDDGCTSQRNGLRFRLSTPRFSRRENLPLPCPFRQWPKLTAAPDRGTAYRFGYQPNDFRVAKI